jgi:hypothetical protein
LIIFSSVIDKCICLRTQGAYPKAHVDATLSSDDDTVPLPNSDVSGDQKMPAGNDAEDDGATSAEPTAPGPISSDVPEQSKPYAVDQVLAIVPPSCRRGRKRPPPATK